MTFGKEGRTSFRRGPPPPQRGPSTQPLGRNAIIRKCRGNRHNPTSKNKLRKVGNRMWSGRNAPPRNRRKRPVGSINSPRRRAVVEERGIAPAVERRTRRTEGPEAEKEEKKRRAGPKPEKRRKTHKKTDPRAASERTDSSPNDSVQLSLSDSEDWPR